MVTKKRVKKTIKTKIQTSPQFQQQKTIQYQQREKHLHTFVSWSAMLLLIFTNILGVLLLIPFLLFFEGTMLYTIIALFAIGFGLLFNTILHAIKELGDKHHLLVGFLIPFCILIDITILFTLVEKIMQTLHITAYYNYTLIIVLFIIAFVIPYLTDILRGKHRFSV